MAGSGDRVCYEGRDARIRRRAPRGFQVELLRMPDLPRLHSVGTWREAVRLVLAARQVEREAPK